MTRTTLDWSRDPSHQSTIRTDPRIAELEAENERLQRTIESERDRRPRSKHAETVIANLRAENERLRAERTTHCRACGGDGIDPCVKTEDGTVARGELRLTCEACGGTGHLSPAIPTDDLKALVLAMREHVPAFAGPWLTPAILEWAGE